MKCMNYVKDLKWKDWKKEHNKNRMYRFLKAYIKI